MFASLINDDQLFHVGTKWGVIKRKGSLIYMVKKKKKNHSHAKVHLYIYPPFFCFQMPMQ